MAAKISSLKDYVTGACAELIPMFGLDHKFMCELPDASLNSGEEVNILVSLSQGVKSSIVVGLTKDAAFKIVSAMMGGMAVTELNEITRSALAEFTNMLGSSILTKISDDLKEVVTITPPTVITGEKMFLMISRSPAKKMFFKFGDTKFNVAYSLE